jgi:hypothetical protein
MTVTPVQTSTYVLSTSLVSTVFGTGTNINVANGYGVWGQNIACSWLLTTKGGVTGTTGVELDFISAYNNSGVITGTKGPGVSMTGGGLFTNSTAGSIYATGANSWGVSIGKTGGGYGAVDDTFANHGLIQGTYGGAQLAGVDNQVRNSGTIQGGQVGLAMNGGGVLVNNGTIVGTGQTGVYEGATANVTDAGTITGGVNAIQFAGGGANSLTLNSGAAINGAILGSTASGATTTLTLNGGGTVNGSLQHITSVSQAGSGAWTLNGQSTLASFALGTGGTLKVGDATHTNADLTLSSLQNAGVVKVYGGHLDVQSTTGAGSMFIYGGALELGSDPHEAVAFSGSGAGLLELDHSTAFGSAISGFNPKASAIDLRDVAFVSPGEGSFNGTTSGGTLTVTDGTHTAAIALTGAFTTSSSFIAESDGHGGTLLFDPTASTNAALADLLHHSLGVTIV